MCVCVCVCEHDGLFRPCVFFSSCHVFLSSLRFIDFVFCLDFFSLLDSLTRRSSSFVRHVTADTSAPLSWNESITNIQIAASDVPEVGQSKSERVCERVCV